MKNVFTHVEDEKDNSCYRGFVRKTHVVVNNIDDDGEYTGTDSATIDEYVSGLDNDLTDIQQKVLSDYCKALTRILPNIGAIVHEKHFTGAPCHFDIIRKEKLRGRICRIDKIDFQDGNPDLYGINGITNDDLVCLLLVRLAAKVPFRSKETEDKILKARRLIAQAQELLMEEKGDE